MPKLPEKPRLHNRQSGTVGKARGNGQAPELLEPTMINDIRCVGDVVPIDSLKPDPNNARLHPDRNMEAIKQSLIAYGQMAPLVVRKQNRVIAAGNGRWQGMKELGWTKVAVSMREMTDAEFAGYALADNRTAELAKWDFEVVARLDKLLSEQQHMTRPGWSSDELEVLRAQEWCPPPEDFPEVDESIPTEHACPKCGYRWSGGES